jgi:hypothetical protein
MIGLTVAGVYTKRLEAHRWEGKVTVVTRQ